MTVPKDRLLLVTAGIIDTFPSPPMSYTCTVYCAKLEQLEGAGHTDVLTILSVSLGITMQKDVPLLGSVSQARHPIAREPLLKIQCSPVVEPVEEAMPATSNVPKMKKS